MERTMQDPHHDQMIAQGWSWSEEDQDYTTTGRDGELLSRNDLVDDGWRWNAEDGDFTRPANLEFDNGTGYSMIMDDLEEQFGKVDFGYAGGNVNMIIDTESGHRINVTDAQQCNLTYLYDHTPAIGYSVGVYDRAAWEGGDDACEPIVLLDGYVTAEELPTLIKAALDAVRKGTCGHYYTKWNRTCQLDRGHTEVRHREAEISWDDAMAVPA